ncbi:hypothetical protein RCL1_001567 [Eukaryota sp. TZLM3-RCL]
MLLVQKPLVLFDLYSSLAFRTKERDSFQRSAFFSHNRHTYALPGLVSLFELLHRFFHIVIFSNTKVHTTQRILSSIGCSSFVRCVLEVKFDDNSNLLDPSFFDRVFQTFPDHYFSNTLLFTNNSFLSSSLTLSRSLNVIHIPKDLVNLNSNLIPRFDCFFSTLVSILVENYNYLPKFIKNNQLVNFQPGERSLSKLRLTFNIDGTNKSTSSDPPQPLVSSSQCLLKSCSHIEFIYIEPKSETTFKGQIPTEDYSNFFLIQAISVEKLISEAVNCPSMELVIESKNGDVLDKQKLINQKVNHF